MTKRTRGRALSRGAGPLLAALAVSGCSRAAPDETPEGAVRLWLETMETSTDDPRATREAYALLGPAAQQNLEERADRAGKVQGRRVEPYEMLAEGRFGLKFRPKSMVAQREGGRAVVEVTGDEPLTEHALVRCAEVVAPKGSAGARWRVEPDLPPLAPAVGSPRN